MSVLGVYGGEIGNAWNQKVNFSEDGKEIKQYNNIVLDQDFKNFCQKTIITYGNYKGKISTNQLMSLKDATAVIFENLDCRQTEETIDKIKKDKANISLAVRQDLKETLLLHLAICRNNHCPAKKYLKIKI